MLDIQVIEDPAAAAVALEPMRSRLLSELAAPASAATLAARVGLARQKVNYHLNALEAHGLVRLAHERIWGGLTERLLVATAASYVVSPGALGPVGADPRREIDRLSASFLIAVGHGSSARWATLFVVRQRRANAWRPWPWIPRFASGRRPTGRLSATNSRRPSRDSFRSITMNPPLAAARIAWWSSRIHCRRNPIPRSRHEREERSVRTPFSPGRNRGPRHAGGSVTGHCHRAWYLVLVRAD